jgi:prophage maintenance system killer protein
MHYLNLDICRQVLFPIIRGHMLRAAPAPIYEEQIEGMEKLRSIFALMAWDTYPDLLSKAAYVFCSIMNGRPFSNGNKRLAVAALVYLLVINGMRVNMPSTEAVQEKLRQHFPRMQWERTSMLQETHEKFFYHLALVISDSAQKGHMTLQQEMFAVRDLLLFMTAEKP